MPVVPPVFAASLASSASSLALTGTSIPSLAMALGQTLAETLSSAVTITASVTGAAGSGPAMGYPITGYDPMGMSIDMINAGRSFGINGQAANGLFLAIAQAICQSLATLQVVGVSAGVGSGAGFGKVTAVNSALIQSRLFTNLGLYGIAGTVAAGLASAIALGFSLHLTSRGVVPLVSAVGPAGPVPASTVVNLNIL